MRIADDTANLVRSRIERADAAVGSCSNCSPAAFAGLILRRLDPRDRELISDLVREIGPSACPQFAAMAAERESPGVESDSASPAVMWLAGVYFAEQPAGFIRARKSSSDGPVEVTLFVGASWRRRGVGALLLEAAMHWASCRQTSTLRFICARDDWPMRHFAKKFGARLDLVLGQIVADIPVVERIGEPQRAPSNC
jgi:GNAT superfamily N-acetyltransferase